MLCRTVEIAGPNTSPLCCFCGHSCCTLFQVSKPSRPTQNRTPDFLLLHFLSLILILYHSWSLPPLHLSSFRCSLDCSLRFSASSHSSSIYQVPVAAQLNLPGSILRSGLACSFLLLVVFSRFSPSLSPGLRSECSKYTSAAAA